MLFVVPKPGGRTIADLGPEHFGVTMEEDDDDKGDDYGETNYNMAQPRKSRVAGGGGGGAGGKGGKGMDGNELHKSPSQRSSRMAWVKHMVLNRVQRKREKSSR